MTEKKCPHGCGKEWIGTTNRRAKRPLDPDAVAAANQASTKNCQRLTNADGTHRLLTMSDDDYFCRRVWMDAYLAALDKKQGKKASPKPKVDPKNPIVTCEKAYLVVKVTDYDGEPIKDVDVAVQGLSNMYTDENGYADYGEVLPRTYDITALKENYSPAPNEPPGPAKTTKDVPPNQTTVALLKLDELPRILRENIIFIGSEEHYNSFWFKMMFVAPGFAMGDRGLKIRKADKNTVVLVDVGYTRFEKLPVETLKGQRGFNVLLVKSTGAIVNYLNDRPQKKKVKTLLQDVVFFCHGWSGTLALNYQGSGPDVEITKSELGSIKSDIFVPDGLIYSYACRTGNSSFSESFNSDEEAHPEDSLAQKMADHFKINVHAFLPRTFYGDLLREKTKEESTRIAAAMKKGRETRKGQVIDIPPEHEGLPHPDLDNGLFAGSKDEGTNEYALWRKQGAIRMPFGDTTPSGLSKSMRQFTPKK